MSSGPVVPSHSHMGPDRTAWFCYSAGNGGGERQPDGGQPVVVGVRIRRRLLDAAQRLVDAPGQRVGGHRRRSLVLSLFLGDTPQLDALSDLSQDAVGILVARGVRRRPLVHPLQSNSGVFLSFLRAFNSWLLSKKRGMNGPRGEKDNSSARFFSSASCWAGRRGGRSSSSIVRRGGGGGGGGGGQYMGEDSSEDREQGEQEESAGPGAGAGGREAVSSVTG
ncbi:hypothetical protein EYF80_039795 [Liparis tanakae]|uniref:Uncharacterized protein n=1 Tax=Liparis tanakae TaxID=230148 RepID=A0A4Z2G8X6_9TELE|nr:hypothetical protein EYF80_039795 [Liparis tanakae]